jgi:hypothetical protein
MLDAGRQMYNAAFKGTAGEAENIGMKVDKKQEQIDSANARKVSIEEKIKKGDNTAANREELELFTDRVKTLEKEKALLVKQKELTEDKAALEDRMGRSTENFKEKFEAQRIKQNQLFLAKQTALGEEYKEIEKKSRTGADISKEKAALEQKQQQLNKDKIEAGKSLAEKQTAEREAVLKKENAEYARVDEQLTLSKSNKLKIAAQVSSDTGAADAASNSRKARVNKKPEAIVDKESAEAAREDTAPEAPKKALGGVVPATINGTTVTVGEKGNPEAIMPLNVLSDMLGSTRDKGDNDQRYAQIIKLNSNFSGSIDISSKSVELEKIGNELSKDNNKLLETEIKTSDKLIISMNKVTDMLPNVLSQIIAATYNNTSGGGATAASGAAPTASGGAAAPTASGGATAPTSTDMLRQAGLILKKGDVQADGKEVDPRIIEIAKQVQSTIPGFSQFTGFNDVYHNENTPKSQHTKGKAFDFTINKDPSKEEGEKIKSQLKALGLDLVKDEYNDTSGAFRTGGHFHGQLNAFDGGVFEPRPGGVHVNLAEAGLREAAVPLNPGEKIRVEKPESDNNPPRKDPLSTVLANDNQSSSNSNQSAEILAALHDLMEDKFDSMISALRDGNDISDKLLKYSQA